jgi:hypothetical protein
LKKLELKNNLFEITTKRRNELENLLKTISNDAIHLVFIHHSKCEALFFMQHEINQFYISLNLLFDYTKSVCEFKYGNTFLYNELEPLKPINLNSNSTVLNEKNNESAKQRVKSADKTKKTKDVKEVVNSTSERDPLAPLFLSSVMKVLPVENINNNNNNNNENLSKDAVSEKKNTKTKPKVHFIFDFNSSYYYYYYFYFIFFNSFVLLFFILF